MKDSPSELTIRQYLLGRLEASSELAEQLSDQMLTDDELSEMVGVIEDEIIEEYLDSTLDPADRRAVEKHFLRPPERRNKLRIAREINKCLEKGTYDAQPDSTQQKSVLAMNRRNSHFRAYAELAAGLLIIVGAGVYIFTLRNNFQSEINATRHELAQAREHSARLEERLNGRRTFQSQMQTLEALNSDAKRFHDLQLPPTVLLTLLEPSHLRASDSIPEVRVDPNIQKMHAEISFDAKMRGPYGVRLERVNGNTIWFSRKEWPFTSQSISLLIVDVPTQAIESGEYRFVVTNVSGPPVELVYRFHVSRS